MEGAKPRSLLLLLLLLSVVAAPTRTGAELCRQAREAPAGAPPCTEASTAPGVHVSATSSYSPPPPVSCTSERTSQQRDERATATPSEAATGAEGVTWSLDTKSVAWNLFWVVVLAVVPLILCACLSFFTYDVWTWLSTISFWTGDEDRAEDDPLLPEEPANNRDPYSYGTCPSPDFPSSETETSPSSGSPEDEFVPLEDAVPPPALPDPTLEAESSF